MKKLLIVFLMIVASKTSIHAQTKIIRGRVIDDRFEIVPGAFITINDTVKVGKTDLNGYFEIAIPTSVKKIVLGAVGIEPASLNLTDECNKIEVVMMLSNSYDFITLKKVDRLRMKRFKQLPKLHKEAFEKGIFKSDKPCYTQEFIPDYKKS